MARSDGAEAAGRGSGSYRNEAGAQLKTVTIGPQALNILHDRTRWLRYAQVDIAPRVNGCSNGQCKTGAWQRAITALGQEWHVVNVFCRGDRNLVFEFEDGPR